VSITESSSLPVGGDLPAPRTVLTQTSGADRLFRGGAKAVALSTLLVLVLIGVFLLIKGYPAFRSQGVGFLTNTGFQTQRTAHGPPVFGVRSALIGTVVVSLIALVIALPVSLGSALFISEYAPTWLKGPATALVDLLAAVPSVIYGLWGFAFLSGHMTGLAAWLSVHLAFIPIFHSSNNSPLYTSSQFIAGTVVGLMVVPIITSIAREVFSLAPAGRT
jgi:phosphate transport system permease protein